MSFSIPTLLKNVQVAVEAPKELDVLCGSKSKAVASHPGNKLLRRKVEACLEEYERARNQQERITINRGIILFMREKFGSRFLKSNQDGSWSVAEEQTVRDKVSHAIRHALVKKQRANKTIEDTKQHDTLCDSIEYTDEIRSRISLVYSRQQQILDDMMKTSGDEQETESIGAYTGFDVSESGCEHCDGDSTVTDEDDEMVTFLADIFRARSTK